MGRFTRKNIITVAVVAWIIGLIGFALPFLKAQIFVEDYTMSGLALISKISFNKELQEYVLNEEVPHNIFLIVSMLAGLAGLVTSAECAAYWEQAKEGHRPIVSVGSGAVSVLCILLFKSIYSREWAVFSFGAGRNIALLCFVVATACMLVAQLSKEQQGQMEEGRPASVFQSADKPQIGSKQIQAKLDALKLQFLNGAITAEEYEREMKLVQSIRDELDADRQASAPTPAAPSGKRGKMMEGTNEAHFSGCRGENAQLICPACGQNLDAKRESCWHCGVKIVFDDDGEE